MNSKLIELPIPTDDGVFVARYSENGLVELDFPNLLRRRGDKAQTLSTRRSSRRLPGKIKTWHRLVAVALKKVLSGKNPKALPPFDWTGATEFQKAVWRAMLKLPSGQTKSYGEIAAVIGRPKALRAVGGACGANPVPVLVPCHRILAANKKLGGFGGGLNWKRKLLAKEGIEYTA